MRAFQARAIDTKATDEARKPLPEKTSTPKERGNKRKDRLDVSINSQQKGKKTKTVTGATSVARGSKGPSYAAIVHSQKVGIVPIEFPQKVISKEDASAIQKEVLKMIAGQRDIRLKFRQIPSRHSG